MNRIVECLPVQRGNVALFNPEDPNAFLHVVGKGWRWRRLPERFGYWQTINVRMSRWAEKGILDRVFAYLQQEQIIQIKIEAGSPDSASGRVSPDCAAELRRTATTIGKSPGGWATRTQVVATDDRTAVTFA